MVIALAVIAVLLLGYVLTVFLNGRANRTADKHCQTKARLLNDQNGQTGQAFRYGWFHARYNLCEVIAVHNAMLLLGTPASLPALIRQFQLHGAMLLYGVFGSNPYAVGRMLRLRNFSARRIRVQELLQCGTFVISFWNGRRFLSGIHTVAVQSDGKSCTVYNLYGNGKVQCVDPKSFANRWICGYYIEKMDER